MQRHTWCQNGVEYGVALMFAVLASSGMISDLCAVLASNRRISDLCAALTISGMVSDFSAGMVKGHSMSCIWYITVLITVLDEKSKHRAFAVSSRANHMLLTAHIPGSCFAQKTPGDLQQIAKLGSACGRVCKKGEHLPTLHTIS